VRREFDAITPQYIASQVFVFRNSHENASSGSPAATGLAETADTRLDVHRA
jgi:hypothetical protein